MMGDSGDWLSAVLPAGLLAGGHGSSSGDGGGGADTLELHKRLVHLATLREEALGRLQALDAAKVSLTEKKAIQQGRLAAALDARLAAAHAAVDPARTAVFEHVRALESAAAFYSRALLGSAPRPQPADWAAATAAYQRLQGAHERQRSDLDPGRLAANGAAALEPCEVGQVQAVEQLRSQADDLQRELAAARSASRAAEQKAAQERAARLLSEQQQHGVQQELRSLRLLAEQVAHQMHPLPPPQQHPQCQQRPQLLPPPQRQQPQEQQQLAAVGHASGEGAGGAAQQLLSECGRIRQQLQLVHDAAARQAAAAWQRHGQDDSGGAAAAAASSGQQPQDALLPLISEDPAWALAGDPLQELRRAVLGGGSGGGGGPLGAAAAAPRPLPREQQLRAAYQQALRQVQAGYQRAARRAELEHQEALQAQARRHTEALSQLSQQHQEACERLAAAAADEAGLRERLGRLQQDHRQLQQDHRRQQQQLQQLQQEAASAAGSALALAQVRHEQQVAALRQELEAKLAKAHGELEEAQRQAKQQAAGMPSEAALAALVSKATGEALQAQERSHQAALRQQRDQQQKQNALLEDLAHLRHTAADPWVMAPGSVQEQAAALGCKPAGVQQQQQQQQQQQEIGASGAGAGAGAEQQPSSPMSSLIAAVLGSGPRGRAMQAAHAQRLEQREGPAQPQHYQQQLEALDRVLGLAPPQAAAGGPPPPPSRGGARQQPQLGASPPRGKGAAAAQRARAACGAPGSPQPRQRHQQQQQQQHPAATSGRCLRCGGDDTTSPRRCQFHPGLVPVPGPLLYTPEWTACRAACTADQPGCYTRREHYYLPLAPGGGGAAAAAAATPGGWAADTCGAEAAELRPRDVLPRPIVPRSPVRVR